MSGVSWKDLRKTAEDATKPLVDGWYECEVEKAEATTASTGSPMIKAVLAVVDGVSTGRKLWTQFVFSADNPNALIFFFRNMAALGLGEAFFDGLTQQGLDVDASMVTIAGSIQGRRVRVKTEIREWNGAKRNNVAELQPSETGPGGLPGGQPAVGLPSVGGGLPGGTGGPPVPPSPVGPAPQLPPTPGAASPGPAGGPPLPF